MKVKRNALSQLKKVHSIPTYKPKCIKVENRLRSPQKSTAVKNESTIDEERRVLIDLIHS
jgi:hypothetical protein